MLILIHSVTDFDKARKPRLGEHTRLGCGWMRLTSSTLTRFAGRNTRNFYALEVFREGAENGTRGVCAPHLNFDFRVKSRIKITDAENRLGQKAERL